MTTTALQTRAFWEAFRSLQVRSRWTMSWSAPWEPMVRNPPPDQAGPEGVGNREAELEVEDRPSSRPPGLRRRSPPIHRGSGLKGHGRHHGTHQVEDHLEGIHPHHRLDPAEIGVDQGQDPDDGDGERDRATR